MPGRREDADRELFDRIATRYVRKDVNPSSRCARRQRFESTLSVVPMKSSWRVLEVGCGAGFGATYIRGRCREYVGLDHSRELVRLAEERNGGAGTEFVATSITDFETERKFDLVFMIGVLHHLENIEQAMASLVQFLTPGGYLLANEPQPANPIISAMRRLRTALDKEYSSDQMQLDRQTLRRVFAQSGLEDIEVRPQGLFATPFAEMPLKPDWLAAGPARFACRIDAAMESMMSSLLLPLSWNLVVVGRRTAG
jgi:SAM-dependent methyltransferase